MRAMSAADGLGTEIVGSARWWVERQARDGRRRPRADGLSIERIISAAVRLVDAEGLEALTVRRLADDLATGSASLYRHVASRDELLVLMVDHVLGEIRLPDEHWNGRRKVEWLSAELRRVLMAHAPLLPALTAAPLLGPNAMRGAENGLTNLLDAGFAPPAAVPAYLALIDYVLGTVYFDTSRAGRSTRVGPEPGRSDLIVALPAEGYPTLRAHEAEFALPSVDEVFTFGLTTFLDGLERRFPPSALTEEGHASADRLSWVDGRHGLAAQGESPMSSERLPLDAPEFWRRPLEARMADFAEMREEGPFTRAEVQNPLTDETDEFFAVTRYAEVVEISRHPQDFCSGRGSTSIADMPAEAMEFFGSFIGMDDPRHARQRGIVARSFTPRQLQGVLDSVEIICAEVIDDMCEKGEVDLVEAISQPFPLLVICDMMGIPRSEFATVLDATNVILGAGDPEMHGRRATSSTALLGAGMDAHPAHERARRVPAEANPTDDLTSALVHNDVGEDMLAPEEIAPVLHPAGGGRQRHHPHRHQPSACTCSPRTPTSGASGRTTSTASPPTAVDEIVRVASPVTFMRRTVTQPLTLSGHDFDEGDKLDPLLRRRQPRSPGVRRPRALRRAPRPQPARRLRRPRPALLPRRPPRPARAARSSSASCSPACPTSRSSGEPDVPRGHGRPARRRHQAPAGALHAHAPARGGVTMARPTAMDEHFVHQLPELLPERRHHAPALAGELLLRHPRPDAARATSSSSRWPTTRPASTWTRCRWAGSAASQLIGLHEPPLRRRPAHHRRAAGARVEIVRPCEEVRLLGRSRRVARSASTSRSAPAPSPTACAGARCAPATTSCGTSATSSSPAPTTGTYTVGGTTHEVDGWIGQRDHSWGIRDHGRCPLWMWFQIQLDDGFLGVWHWELANGARVYTDGCWARHRRQRAGARRRLPPRRRRGSAPTASRRVYGEHGEDGRRPARDGAFTLAGGRRDHGRGRGHVRPPLRAVPPRRPQPDAGAHRRRPEGHRDLRGHRRPPSPLLPRHHRRRRCCRHERAAAHRRPTRGADPGVAHRRAALRRAPRRRGRHRGRSTPRRHRPDVRQRAPAAHATTAPTDAPADAGGQAPGGRRDEPRHRRRLRSYENEVRFYQQLAPDLPIRDAAGVPRRHRRRRPAELRPAARGPRAGAPGRPARGVHARGGRGRRRRARRLHAPRWGDPALAELEWLHRDRPRASSSCSMLLPTLWEGFRERYDGRPRRRRPRGRRRAVRPPRDLPHADTRAVDRRARRLPARQPPVRSRAGRRARSPSSTGRPAPTARRCHDVAYFIGAGLLADDRAPGRGGPRARLPPRARWPPA